MNQERDPRPYELMTVFVPELSEEDNQAQIERTEGYITAAGGTLTETLVSSPWGRRRLAYTIRYNGVDYRDGFYTVFHFDARPTQLSELEREMKLDTNVMRYLLVHDDPKAGEQFTGEEGDEAETAQGETAPAEATADVQATTGEAATETVASTETEPAPATEEAPAQDAEAAAEVAAEPSDTAASEADDAAPAAETATDEAAAETDSSDDSTTKE